MADCELLSNCLFFNDQMANIPATAELTKSRFCRGDRLKCARYLVSLKLGRLRVPQDLYPTDTAGAQKILASES